MNNREVVWLNHAFVFVLSVAFYLVVEVDGWIALTPWAASTVGVVGMELVYQLWKREAQQLLPTRLVVYPKDEATARVVIAESERKEHGECDD